MNKLDNITTAIRRIVEILLVELDYTIRAACEMTVRSHLKSAYLMFSSFRGRKEVSEENLQPLQNNTISGKTTRWTFSDMQL